MYDITFSTWIKLFWHNSWLSWQQDFFLLLHAKNIFFTHFHVVIIIIIISSSSAAHFTWVWSENVHMFTEWYSDVANTLKLIEINWDAVRERASETVCELIYSWLKRRTVLLQPTPCGNRADTLIWLIKPWLQSAKIISLYISFCLSVVWVFFFFSSSTETIKNNKHDKLKKDIRKQLRNITA